MPSYNISNLSATALTGMALAVVTYLLYRYSFGSSETARKGGSEKRKRDQRRGSADTSNNQEKRNITQTESPGTQKNGVSADSASQSDVGTGGYNVKRDCRNESEEDGRASQGTASSGNKYIFNPRCIYIYYYD